MIERGSVTEAFKSVDQLHEGENPSEEHADAVPTSSLTGKCFLRRDPAGRAGALLHGDPEHAGRSCWRGGGVKCLRLYTVADVNSGVHSLHVQRDFFIFYCLYCLFEDRLKLGLFA